MSSLTLGIRAPAAIPRAIKLTPRIDARTWGCKIVIKTNYWLACMHDKWCILTENIVLPLHILSACVALILMLSHISQIVQSQQQQQSRAHPRWWSGLILWSQRCWLELWWERTLCTGPWIITECDSVLESVQYLTNAHIPVIITGRPCSAAWRSIRHNSMHYS